MNIFCSISYDITGVSVTYKKNIGQWVAVQKRIVKIQDSRGAKGNRIIPEHTCPRACVCDSTPEDGHGECAPKIVSFMKACDGHMPRIYIYIYAKDLYI